MSNPLTVVWSQLQTGDVVLAIALLAFAVWLVYRLLRLWHGSWVGIWGERAGRTAGHMAVLLGLEQAYELSRGLIPHQTDVAMLNAYRVLDLEWRHGFFDEYKLQHFFLQFGALDTGIDLFYIAAHVTVTIGVLVWLATCRPQHLPFMRNLLIFSTAIALVTFYVFPTAPPRMLWNYGFVDPLQLHHLVDFGGAQPDSYTYNPYAAMPSLHVGYALVAGWSVFVAARRRLVRGIAMVYPVVMAAVVIITGNHWLLDVAGACVTVLLAGGMHVLVTRLQGLILTGHRTAWIH
jgi:hypothetical protein